jgi:hypothetical protein
VSTPREAAAQRAPEADLTDFPVRRTAPTATMHRAHLASRGPWWFASGGGRFDLPVPQGTCYLATSALAAVRERLGPVLAGRSTLPAAALDGVVVSRLALGLPGQRAPLRLANVRVSAAADFGVTRELESMTPYDVPAAWAAALAGVGLDGIWYGPRFSPGTSGAVALFGRAGLDERRPLDPEPVAASGVRGVPVRVEPPRRRDL